MKIKCIDGDWSVGGGDEISCLNGLEELVDWKIIESMKVALMGE